MSVFLCMSGSPLVCFPLHLSVCLSVFLLPVVSSLSFSRVYFTICLYFCLFIGLLTRHICTDKKENQIFLIYKEIQNGAVAKSYMTNGLLIYGEIFAHFLILGSRSSFMTLQLLHSEFPYCAANFSFAQLAKRKSLGRSKPATNSQAQALQHTVWNISTISKSYRTAFYRNKMSTTRCE